MSVTLEPLSQALLRSTSLVPVRVMKRHVVHADLVSRAGAIVASVIRPETERAEDMR